MNTAGTSISSGRAGRLVLAAAVLPLALGAAAPAPAPLPVQEVADGVFVYQAPYELASPANGGAIANVGFVVGHDAVAVIDTGNSYMAGARLEAAIRAHTSLPIRYVVNTHMHPDHVLGDAAFVDAAPTADPTVDAAAGPVRFVAHYKLPGALSVRAETYLASAKRLVGDTAFAGTRIVVPDLLVDGRLRLDLGGRVLELESQPTAHTDNDLTVLDTRTGTWFLGDLLFVGHVPSLDGSLRGWRKLMQQLRERRVARVVPGHGPASVPWPDALEPQERYLAALEADVRRMLAEGRGMAEAAGAAGLGQRDGWALFDDFNAHNATAAYHELEWE